MKMSTIDTLVCRELTKKYKDKVAVKNFNMTLEKGKIYGLIGRNGAGKTTLLSMLSSQNPATAGVVEWNGENIWENPNALSHICFSREINIGTNGSGLGEMKAKQYIKTAAMYYPNWNQAMADELIEKFELDVKKKLNKLSKGMLSMITIIVAMASKADFTFLDEPVAGLDVVMREYFYRLLLEEYTRTGRTFVISTHIIEEASDVFEEVIMMKDGELLLKENTIDLLERSYRISGLAEEVERMTAGMEVHNREVTGRSKSVTVLLREGQQLPRGFDVTIQPLNLQNVFLALCGMGE
ncbi:MAG: ABC transporter ATP-binding protein [Roseburia sp.]|nr:ABC transporter ATP-binding protein [Roseburia sp.]